MVSLVALGVCAAMAIMVLAKPMIALLIYVATASYADGFGMSMWLGETSFFRPTMQALLLILVIRATIRVLLSHKVQAKSPRKTAVASLMVTGWIVMATFYKGYDAQGSLAVIPYVALPYLVIWLAFGDARRSRSMLFSFVGAQALFALAVLTVPQLQFLQGQNSVMFDGRAIQSSGGTNLSLPNEFTAKGEIGGHYAQFHNPNALGLYASIALVVGIAMLTMEGAWKKILSLGLLALGGFLWLNSLTRGPVLGAFLGLLLFFVMKRQGNRSGTSPVAGLIGFAFFVGVIWVAIQMGVMSYLLPDDQNVSVTNRLDGYALAWQLISSDPVFGIPMDYTWEPVLRPHFISLLFAAEYGLVAGVGITWIVFFKATGATFTCLRSTVLPTHDALTVGLLLGALVGIAATNNFAAPGVFAIALGHVFLVASSVDERAATAERNLSGGAPTYASTTE